MRFIQKAIAATAVLSCLGMAGCAQDTPKTVHENKEEYLTRNFGAEQLSKSMQNALAQSAGEPAHFNKISIKRESNFKTSAGVDMKLSSDLIYRNAGKGLAEKVETDYSNGIENETTYSLTYRGVYPLIWQKFFPNNTKLPPIGKAESISQIDLSFDKPSLNYAYRADWNVAKVHATDLGMSCMQANTYPASKLNPQIQGTAREYNCTSTNANGIAAAAQTYVYLETYGVAVLSKAQKTDLVLNWDITDFKVE
jgi:hypothetical protein